MKKILFPAIIILSLFIYYLKTRNTEIPQTIIETNDQQSTEKSSKQDKNNDETNVISNSKESKKVNKNIPTENPEYNTTPLLQEIELGNFEETKELIQRGANIEQESLNGRTPIIAAIEQDRTDIIQLLSENGLKISKTFGPDNINYLMYASLNNNTKTIKMLAKKIDVNAKDDTGKTAAHHAVIQGSDDALFTLLHLKANFDLKDNLGKNVYDYIEEQEPEIKAQLERVFER